MGFGTVGKAEVDVWSVLVNHFTEANKKSIVEYEMSVENEELQQKNLKSYSVYLFWNYFLLKWMKYRYFTIYYRIIFNVGPDYNAKGAA